MSMYTRGYKAAVAVPPLLWVVVFFAGALLDSFLLQLLERFGAVASSRALVEFR